MATVPDNDIPFINPASPGIINLIPKGTPGQVLQQGATGPAWADSSSNGLIVKSQGTVIATNPTFINFMGAGVVAEADGAGVDVWTPPPTFVSHFNTADGTDSAAVSPVSTSSRYVSAPASEGVPFKIGNWAAGTLQSCLTSSSLSYATAGLFSIFDNTTTTLAVTVLDADGATVLATNTQTLTGNLDNTTQNIRIQITGFVADTNKFKAQLTVTIGIGALLVNGGRFSVQMSHVDGTDGTFTFAQNNIFRDRNTQTAVVTAATMAEAAKSTKHLSGVEFYTTGSTFTVGATGINELNDASYPSTLVTVAGSLYGLAQLNLAAAALTGWTDVYNNTGASYSGTWTISTANYAVVTAAAYIIATPQDWAAGAGVNSGNAAVAIDTMTATQTALFEGFNNETLRLKSDLLTPWDSTQNLATYDSNTGLQVLGSRLVYPQQDFTPYAPDAASQPNYSALAGSRTYIRAYSASGVAHSNGTLLFSDYNITEGDLTAGNVVVELSLDGTNWYNAGVEYTGGALVNGSGCRINAGACALNINNELQFTFGAGGTTGAGTGGGWGVWVRITFTVKTPYLGGLMIADW